MYLRLTQYFRIKGMLQNEFTFIFTFFSFLDPKKLLKVRDHPQNLSKLIYFCSHLKSSKNNALSDDFMGNRS